MKKFLFIVGLFVCVACVAGWQNQNFGGTGLPSGLLFSAPTFTVSGVGSGNGVLALAGTTSGTATFTAPSVAGTVTNPVLVSNTLQLASGNSLNFNADTAITRLAAGVFAVGTTASGNTTGFVKTAQTLQVVTINYTTSATTLATAGVVTGLNFTAPANVASNWSFRCDLIYSQATAAAADLFGVTTAGTAPTNVLVGGEVLTSNVAVQVDGNAIITTATSTTVVTATPSASGAIGTSADMFVAHLWGTVEAPSSATPTQVGISIASGAGADALTVYRGSSCWFY